MKILRRLDEVTKLDKVRNEIIGERLKIEGILRKIENLDLERREKDQDPNQ